MIPGDGAKILFGICLGRPPRLGRDKIEDIKSLSRLHSHCEIDLKSSTKIARKRTRILNWAHGAEWPQMAPWAHKHWGPWGPWVQIPLRRSPNTCGHALDLTRKTTEAAMEEPLTSGIEETLLG